MFSTLSSLLVFDSARVLDLYAGSGALGIEALSRGADSACFVEHAPAALAALRANLTALALPGATVCPQDAEQFLRPPATSPLATSPFELALLDPPYALDVHPVLELLRAWLVDNAVVAVERATRTGELTWPKGYAAVRSRRYGDTTIWYGASASVAPP